MIDTIRVKYQVAPSTIQLNDRWEHFLSGHTDGTIREKYTYNARYPDQDLTIRWTYYPWDYLGNPLTSLELSLPKAVYGNNYTMIQDLPSAISCVNKLLFDDPYIPRIDFGEGIIIRFDPCYNHMVGGLVPYYINAIANLDYPHRRTKYHRNEGAEFRSKQITTKFYDKQRETNDLQSFGILRQETTFLNPTRIAEILGKKKPTIRDITPEAISTILVSDLINLKLFGRSIADRDTALSTLIENYGSYAGMYYWGILQAKLSKTKEVMANETKQHPRSIDRRIKSIADAGIAPTLTDFSEPLPPLEIKL